MVKALSKDDNEVCQITTVSLDGLIELRHYIERSALAAKETSMKPFLDNSHVDKTHKYRVLFQGTHVLKGTKRDSQGLYKIERRGPTNPTYTFDTKKGLQAVFFPVQLVYSLISTRLPRISILTPEQRGCALRRRVTYKLSERAAVPTRYYSHPC